MKNARVRYASKIALHVCAIMLCAGCQSLRWGERSTDELDEITKAREVYSNPNRSFDDGPYWKRAGLTGGPLGNPW
jgi:hypothetical protein